MPEDFADSDSSPETQPAPARIPPGSPPSTAAAVEERPAEQRGWRLRDALPVVLFLLFLSALSLVSGAEQPLPKVGVRAVLVVQSFFYFLILLYIYSVVRLKHQLPFWSGLGWRRAAGRAQFLFAGAALALLVQMVSLPVKTKLPIERLFHSQEAAYLLAAFGILVAPLVEEMIFRGFLFVALERSWGLRAAVWSTAVLFATIHVPQLRGGGPQVLAIFGVGLVLSWVRGRTGSLAPPYFMHLAYNTTLFAMFYSATRGFRQFG